MGFLEDLLKLKFVALGLSVLLGTVGYVSYTTSDFVLLSRLVFLLTLALLVVGLFANYASEMF